MPELTIYDSHGKPYGDGGRGRSNDRIEEFFFGGVKLYLDAGSRTELVVFFRARESNVGRAEQFYAVYTARNTRNLFENFKSDLRRRVETEYGMSIETTSDDVQVYEALGGRNDAVPGSEFDHSVVSKLLQSGNRLRFGVSSAGGALGLCSKYLQESANRVAIADNTSIDALESCDLAVEIGTHRGLEPLGETSRLMDEQRRSMEGQLINEKVTTIEQEVDDLRTKTSKSDEQIRNRLKRQLSIFETPPPPSSTGGRFDALPDLSRPQKIGSAVGLVVLIALISVVTAGLLGFGPGADTLGLNGDESEAALEDISVAGTALENGSEQSVSLSDGNLTVTGETDQETVTVTFEPDDGNSTENQSDVDNDSFDVTLTGLEAGSGELTIEAGSTGEDGFETATSESFDLELVDDSEPRLEALRIADISFDDLEENETVSVPDGELTVSGETGHETVDVRYEPDEGDLENGSTPVENGTFAVTLTDLGSGSGTLFIEAATTSEDGDLESSTNRSLELEKPSLESLTADGVSFEELDNGTLIRPDEGVAIEGQTNQENVTISYNGEPVNETETDENDSFAVILTELKAGTGELTVKAGTTDDNDTFESITFDLESPTIENVSVEERSSNDLEESENTSVSISDGKLNVTGKTNLESVSVVFEPDSDEQNVTTEPATVDDGEFTATLSKLEAGAGELRVEAGDAAFESAAPDPLRIELVNDSNQRADDFENLSVENRSFDDLEENETITVSNGELNVTGETNRTDARIVFDPADGNQTDTSVNPSDDGAFTETLPDLEAGSGDLRVEVTTTGEGEDAEFESVITRSIYLELDDSS